MPITTAIVSDDSVIWKAIVSKKVEAGVLKFSFNFRPIIDVEKELGDEY